MLSNIFKPPRIPPTGLFLALIIVLHNNNYEAPQNKEYTKSIYEWFKNKT